MSLEIPDEVLDVKKPKRSLVLLGMLGIEVVVLSIVKPIWIFNLFLVGRMILDFVMPGYFVPINQPHKVFPPLPARAPIHRHVERPTGLG